jgi:hypothetical protein
MPLVNSNSYYDFPLEMLQNYEWKRMKNLLLCMKMENRLCGETGEAVCAEFGFKGNFDVVKEKLWSLMNEIRKNGFKESDRNELFVRHQRLLKHQLEQDNNPYLVKYNAVRKQGLEKAIKILDAMRKSKENLHKSKECLCFNNN